MDFVTKLMTVLEGGPVPTVTWLPRQQNQNDTAISTYWTFDAITNAFVLTLKKFAWKNIGEFSMLVSFLGKLNHLNSIISLRSLHVT